MGAYIRTTSVLKKITAGRGATAVFSYCEAFNVLWKTIEELDGDQWPPLLIGDIYIVWDDVPSVPTSSDFNFKNHLTVYDWVAALTVSIGDVLRKTKHKLPQPFHLHVLDCTERQLWAGSFSVGISSALQGLLPWLTIYLARGASGTKFIVGLTKEVSTHSLCTDRSVWQTAAQLVRRIWTGELTHAEDHH